MNNSQKTRFKEHVKKNKFSLLSSLIVTGAGRGNHTKESNYSEILYILGLLGCNTTKADVEEGLALLEAELGRTVEIKEPPRDNGAAAKLATLLLGASNVQAVLQNVEVKLDNDQLKHQHPSAPIGTRIKGGGNRFVATCNSAWHIANTLQHMANWASGLNGMAEGQTIFHGQAVPVNFIHYEGFCLMANGKKYVLFHCYPADNSPLKL